MRPGEAPATKRPWLALCFACRHCPRQAVRRALRYAPPCCSCLRRPAALRPCWARTRLPRRRVALQPLPIQRPCCRTPEGSICWSACQTDELAQSPLRICGSMRVRCWRHFRPALCASGWVSPAPGQELPVQAAPSLPRVLRSPRRYPRRSLRCCRTLRDMVLRRCASLHYPLDCSLPLRDRPQRLSARSKAPTRSRADWPNK